MVALTPLMLDQLTWLTDMEYTNAELKAAILSVTDQDTLNLIIQALRNPPSPFSEGQIVVSTSTGKPVHWDDTMRPQANRYRAINRKEAGSGFTPA